MLRRNLLVDFLQAEWLNFLHKIMRKGMTGCYYNFHLPISLPLPLIPGHLVFVSHFRHCFSTPFADHEEPAAPGEQQATKPPPKVFSDDEIANIVDTVITDNDENGDGYVEYFEFKRKQQQQRQQYDSKH